MKMQWKSRLLIALMVGLLIFPGCQGTPAPNPDPEEPETMTMDVIGYFVNDEYVRTGDANLPAILTEERSIEVSPGEEPYQVLLEMLRDPKEEGHGTMVTDLLNIHSVSYSESDADLLLVDLGMEEGLIGGSTGEMMLIRQIVETLLKNEELAGERQVPQRIRLLVDGAIVESLMGHVDTREPFEIEW